MNKIKIQNRVKKFEEYLIVERGLSKITVDGYCRCLRIVLRRSGKTCSNYRQIKEHILWMHEKQYSYSHIVNTSLALEHYARLNGLRIRIGRPRKPKRIIKDVLSESEVSRLIQATKNVREQAIICLFSYSGIRNLELCGLKVDDIDLGANHIRILGGKNKKDRIVNISPECTRTLIEYLRQYPRERNEFLFTTLVRGNRLAPGDTRKIIRVLAQRARIGRRVYPHLLRHSLATNLLNRGASLIMIQNQLGHAFIESTMIYVTSQPFRNRSEYDFYKPAYM